MLEKWIKPENLRFFGIISIIFGELSIWISILLLDSFDWQNQAISDLGVFPASALTFNLLNIIAGILFGGFFVFLLKAKHFKLLTIISFGMGVISSTLLGLFPTGDPLGLHFPIAIVNFSSYFTGVILLGTDIYNHQKALGIFSLIIMIIALLLMILFFNIFEGIAIGEFAFIICFQIWVIIFTLLYNSRKYEYSS